MTSSTPFLVLMMIYRKSFHKSASGANKFTSIQNRMSMKLHRKLGGFLRIKTETSQKLLTIRAVDGTSHPKRIVWRLTLAAARRRC